MKENKWQQAVIAMERYLAYQGEKYIAPAKAGELAEEMEAFKLAGQQARQGFQLLVKGLLGMSGNFHADRVSAWMNQAQIGRPHFWCYFFLEGDTRLDPTYALRLKTIDGQLGISCELSFIERGSVPETLRRQNQVLEVLVGEDLESDSVYYWVQISGESEYYVVNETSRKTLQSLVAKGVARKVLVKYDIPSLSDYSSVDEVLLQIQAGVDKLTPFFEATR